MSKEYWPTLLDHVKRCNLFVLMCIILVQASYADKGLCHNGETECLSRVRYNGKCLRYRWGDLPNPNQPGVSCGWKKTDVCSDDSLSSKFMHQVANSKAQMMKGLDSVMDKMSVSRNKVMEGLDSVMDKVSKSKVMEKVREGIDKVAHSKMMEELDHVIDSVAHSKVMEEIRALPRELRESFILSVRNRSYFIAGLLVSIASFILFLGAIYYAWCHHDAWSYHIGTIEDAKALLKKAKDSAEKCVSNAAIASSNGDFASDLCNMSYRGCQGDPSDSSRGIMRDALAVSESISDSSAATASDEISGCAELPMVGGDASIGNGVLPDGGIINDDSLVYQEKYHEKESCIAEGCETLDSEVDGDDESKNKLLAESDDESKNKLPAESDDESKNKLPAESDKADDDNLSERLGSTRDIPNGESRIPEQM